MEYFGTFAVGGAAVLTQRYRVKMRHFVMADTTLLHDFFYPEDQ
jgi:hypothetical protein